MDSSESEQSDIEFYDDSDDEFLPSLESSASESDMEYLSSDSNAENIDSENAENLPEFVTENLSAPIEENSIWTDYEGRHRVFEFKGICRLFELQFFSFFCSCY